MKETEAVGNATKLKKIHNRIRLQIVIAVASFLLLLVLAFAMTAAWYTNTAKTGAMTFETKSWGFDESKITIGMDESTILGVNAAGIVPINIDNSECEDNIRVKVNVSKALMPLELQKRIYFYTDTSEERVLEGGNETVRPVYISAVDNSYSYFVAPGQMLTLGEDFCSDVPVKWEWVHDMQGYYFSGTVADGSVTIEEYLRPIEYDSDHATWYTAENMEENEQDEIKLGQLRTVDGEIEVDTFLVKLSQNDGYPGTIDVENKKVVHIFNEEVLKGDPTAGNTENEPYFSNGYHYFYPVRVDETGKGVWAYLCTLGEVEAGNEFDTEFAQDPSQMISGEVRTEVTISVTSIKRQNAAQTDTAESLVDAIAEASDAGTDSVIELTNDIAFEETLTVESGSVLIDLNGYSLTCTEDIGNSAAFSVSEGASLTLQNGHLFRKNGDTGAATGVVGSRAVDSMGGTVVLGGMTISGFDSAIYLHDMDGENGKDSIVKISNCDISAKETAIFLQGNGGKSAEVPTRVIIQKTKIVSDYIGISGQGSSGPGDERWGTDLIVSDSEISGYWAGIYHPQQNSTVTVMNSTISGYTGIAVKGSSIRIKDCKVTGTGAYHAAAAASSGWTDTGDGIYMEAVYGWGATLKLEGSGNSVTSTNGYAVQLFGKAGTLGSVTISNGTYGGGRGSCQWNGIGAFAITGGEFTGKISDNIDTIAIG